MAKFTAADAKRRWEARAARYTSVHTGSFKSSMSLIWNIDKLELDRQVYGTAKPTKRSGNLRGYEKMRFQGSNIAVLTNTASSIWKGVTSFYAHFVHKGVKARNKGRKYYAWMVDPRQPRPTSWEEWLRARDEGKAILAHKLKAVRGKPWRKMAMQQAKDRGIRAAHWRQANKDVHNSK